MIFSIQRKPSSVNSALKSLNLSKKQITKPPSHQKKKKGKKKERNASNWINKILPKNQNLKKAQYFKWKENQFTQQPNTHQLKHHN